MKMKALIGAALMSVMPFASQASPLPNGPHIETSGVGVVEVAPDMATLIIQVNTSAKKSADAKKQLDDRVAQYFSFLEKMGVDKKDIDAANLATRAQYDYSKSGGGKLTGYAANRTVTVKIRQLDKLNPILDGALEAQLNEISSIQLGVADEENYKTQAKKRAMENATKQAQSLAEGFGAKLGPIYRISYQAMNGQNSPMPVMLMARSAKANDGYSVDATYTQDTIKFEDSVSVVFDILR
jgi:uncharacterized protein YggE